MTRRFRVGTRGFPGEPGAVSMLLDARLHMARRALGEEAIERACAVEMRGETLSVVADFTTKGTIELFSVAFPANELRAAVETWVAARHASR